MTNETQPTKRRWFQFSLRGLFILLTIVCLCAAWIGRDVYRYRQQEAFVQQNAAAPNDYIKNYVQYDYQYDENKRPTNAKEAPGNKLLRFIFGDKLYCQIDFVSTNQPQLLQNTIPLQKLSELRICDKETADLTLDEQTASKLATLPKLRGIGFHNAHVSPEAWKALSKSQSLQHIAVSNTTVTQTDLKEIAKFPQLIFLQIVYADKLNAAALQELSQAKSLLELQLNSINPNVYRDGGLAFLNELLKPEKLILADNSGSLLDQNAIEISKATSLKLLKIFGPTSFTDKALSEFVKLKQLQSLQVFSDSFTDAGLQYLTQLKKLTYLDIGSKQFTDKAIDHLLQMDQLQQLKLSDCLITDAGLVRLAKHPTLKYLRVRTGLGITDAGIEQFKKLNPNCQIDFSAADPPPTTNDPPDLSTPDTNPSNTKPEETTEVP